MFKWNEPTDRGGVPITDYEISYRTTHKVSACNWELPDVFCGTEKARVLSMRVRDQNADILHRILGDPMFRTVLPGEKKVQCGSGQNEKCCAWKVRPTPDGMSAKAGTRRTL